MFDLENQYLKLVDYKLLFTSDDFNSRLMAIELMDD